MNDRLAATAAPPARHAALFERQRHAFLQAPCPSAAQRRDDLRRLKRELLRHQDVLAEAMSQDFGYRAPAESKMLDILGSTLEINHALRHLGRWMKPRRRSTELLFLTNRLRVTYQPKGVVGVIVPWNFPIYLALGPLAAALAAGNRVMVKMPEATPATNACLPRVLDALRSLGLPLTRVDYVFLTHVHLDHAGGAGAMMQTFPEARLVVHPRGVRHMADPAPLFAAVQAVYGADAAEQLYGELVPVPVERILAAGDGHTLDLGGRTLVCLDTPGHARHHLSLLDTHSGGLFAGEAFGISLRELDVDGRASILPAIAPTQFDPAAMQASVGRILALQPPALYLAHFGRIRDVPRLGGDLLRQIEAQVALAERERDCGSERGARLLAGLWALVNAEAARQGWRLAADSLHAVLDEYLALNAQALDGWLVQTAPRPSAR